MSLLAPSLLSCDFLNLNQELIDLENAGITRLHYDVMDGHFVPNLTFGAGLLGQITKRTEIQIDVHLMVNNPSLFLHSFAENGAHSLFVHVENTPHLHKDIIFIKEHNVKAGVTLNPATSWEIIKPILPFIDKILFMTVNPGFGGQRAILEVFEKIKSFKKYIEHTNFKIEIIADGGINQETAQYAVNAGCDVIVVGSAFFKNKNYLENRLFYEGIMPYAMG
jgi:ribulose-phosphate 3-epimerase